MEAEAVEIEQNKGGESFKVNERFETASMEPEIVQGGGELLNEVETLKESRKRS